MIQLSIVVPIYNVKPFLERCVNSVISQTYKHLEIILVDDGSTDGSGEIADTFAAHDARIRVIHQENRGLSVARNVGIHASTGEYVVFLDADDEWLLPDGIEKMLNDSPKGCDMIVFKRVDFWFNGHRSDSEDYDLEAIAKLPSTADIFTYLVETQQLQISACFLMTRRTILLDNKIFFVEGHADEDVSWNLHLWQCVSSTAFHNLPFYAYHHRPHSITTTPSLHAYRSSDRIIAHWKVECQNGCVNSKSILNFMANLWVSLGYRVFKLKKEHKQEAISILTRHKDLLHYATTNKSRRTARLVNAFGVKGAVHILGIYWRLRTISKGHIVK